MSVLPAVGVTGGRDEDVAVLQIDDGGAVAVCKPIVLGGDRRRDVFDLPVVEKGVLEFEDAIGLVLHLVERRAGKSRLRIQRLVVLFRPALLCEDLGEIGPGIGGDPAHRRIDDRVGDQHKTDHDR